MRKCGQICTLGIGWMNNALIYSCPFFSICMLSYHTSLLSHLAFFISVYPLPLLAFSSPIICTSIFLTSKFTTPLCIYFHFLAHFDSIHIDRSTSSLNSGFAVVFPDTHLQYITSPLILVFKQSKSLLSNASPASPLIFHYFH